MNHEKRLFVRLSKDAFKECQRRAKIAGTRSASGHVRDLIKKALEKPESTAQHGVVAGPFVRVMAIAFPEEDRVRIIEAAEREAERTGMALDESAMARLLLYRGMALADRKDAPDEVPDNGSRKIRRAS